MSEEDFGFEDFDFGEFKPIPHCQFGVPDPSHWSGVGDCSEPSVCIAKWSDGSTMYLCQEHAEFVEEKELECAEQAMGSK